MREMIEAKRIHPAVVYHQTDVVVIGKTGVYCADSKRRAKRRPANMRERRRIGEGTRIILLSANDEC